MTPAKGPEVASASVSRSAGAPVPVLVFIAVASSVLAVVLRVMVNLPVAALVEGVAFAGAGLLAWARRPDNRTGKLMVAYGVMVWSIHLQNTTVPLLWTAAGIFFPVAVFGVLVYLILAFPHGRLGSTWDRVLVGVAFGNVVFQISAVLWLDPRAVGCVECPPALNLLLVRPDADMLMTIARINPWWLSVVMFPMIGLLVARWFRATPPARRVLGPMLIPAVVFLLANRIYGLAQALSGDPFGRAPEWLAMLRNAEQAAIIVLPVTFLLGLVRSRLRHTRVSRLVVELGEMPPAGRLEEALQRALGDPSLVVGVWDTTTNTFVRGNGEELRPVQDAPGLVVTRLERDGAPLALVVHDEALLDEPALVDATAAATRMAIENEALQAEIRAQLEEVQASRQRIVNAQDEERRKIERDLHDGAQQRLLRLSMAIQVAESSIPPVADPALRTSLEVAADELRAALQELRELAHGIHPAVLTQRGLGAAIRSLAETAPVPVVVEEVVDSRLSPDVETAAYYFVSEALANVAKHASASVARVRAIIVGEQLVLDVVDDGRGGASQDHGSGLRGLADRLHALGGELKVESPAGRGTRLTATIPVAREERMQPVRTESTASD